MPLVGDSYVEQSEDDLIAFLEAELRSEFGVDIDLTESSAFRTFTESLAGLDANEIEPAIKEIHDSAFIESAEDELLEKKVAILGISRREATHATGVIEFQHGGISDGSYTIDNGTIVQTNESDPVEFETTNLVTLSLFDDFESGSLAPTYSGQTGNGTVVDGSAGGDPSPMEGENMLRLDAADGSQIYQTANVVSRGSKMSFNCYLQDSGTANATALANMFGVQDGDNYYRTVLDSSGRHAIELVTSNGVTTFDETTAAAPTDQWVRNEVDWFGEANGTIVSRLYNENDVLVDEIRVTGENEIDEGGYGYMSLDANDNKYWDVSGETAVRANARARNGGTVGNVGANSLTSLPVVPSGVNGVANPYPMGDDTHRLTNTVQFTVGRPRETDEELRDRATVSEGALGKATVPAMIAAVRGLPQAESVSVYQNKTDSTKDGLPPTSFEVVYYGTDPNQLIANTIFETKGFTAHDVGGVHGTEVTETYEAENGQVFTVHWTEPTELSVDMTLDIVVNDEFVGKDELRDRIVNYVGGTASDGTHVLGTGSGEDVYVDQIEDVVTGPDDTGVIGIGSYSFTPATSTDGNGLEVVSVGANETAITNAQDDSITINVTRV